MKKTILTSAALVAIFGCATAPEAPKAPAPAAKYCKDAASVKKAWRMPFQIGCAGYTFRDRNTDEMLAIMESVDVHNLCVKDFHLKYDATDAEIAAFKAKCAAHGVRPYALGPLYTKDNASVRKYFEFAKRFGAKLVVGVPYDADPAGDKWNTRKGSRKQLEYIDRLVKEFDIRYAIHNHGPSAPDMFPDVAYGWNLIKDLDPRIGFCMDVGWEYGSDRDPVNTIRQYGDRIFDIHLKNFAVDLPGGRVLSKTVPHSFTGVPMPRGDIDYGRVFKALAEVGYTGVCSLEYEKDFNNNLGPIAESIGYIRGVCDTIRVKPQMKPVPTGANTLTEAEKAEGYQLLFDGQMIPEGLWVGVKKDWAFKRFPARGWFVKEGCLTMRPLNGIHPETGRWFPLPPEDQKLAGGGDIVTVKKYSDFIFKFDFRLTEAANSGVKYFYDETQNDASSEEYQILENAHPDSVKGKDGNRKVASLYDIFPAHADSFLKPTGEWNSGMIVSKGTKVEHWLNGHKVLEYDRSTSAFAEGVKVSKYGNWGKDATGKPQPWGLVREGRLLLQDHSDSTVSFCNLKVLDLKGRTK